MGGAIHRLTVHPIESADGLSGGLWSSARLAPHNVLRQNAIFSERFRPTDHRCIQNHIPAIFHRLIRCTTLSHSLSLSLSRSVTAVSLPYSARLCVIGQSSFFNASVKCPSCRRTVAGEILIVDRGDGPSLPLGRAVGLAHHLTGKRGGRRLRTTCGEHGLGSCHNCRL